MIANTENSKKARLHFIDINKGYHIIEDYNAAIINMVNQHQLKIHNIKMRKIQLQIEEQEKQMKEKEELYRITLERTNEINSKLSYTTQTEGFFYIIKSDDPKKNFIYKFGKARDTHKRLSGHRTTDPSMELVKEWKVNDLDSVERMVMDMFRDIRVWHNHEFFYRGTDLVEQVDAFITFINPMINHNRVNDVRQQYINNIALQMPEVDTKHTSSRSRTPKRLT
jgi:hypothetical protein